MNVYSFLSASLSKRLLIAWAIMGCSLTTIPMHAAMVTSPLAVQTDTLENNKVDQPAAYRGGPAALFADISSNLKYTKAMIDAGVQGKVMVRFVVNDKGKVTDVAVIKSLSAEADAEAARVVKQLGRFKPARHQGKKVPVLFYLPIGFTIK